MRNTKGDQPINAEMLNSLKKMEWEMDTNESFFDLVK